MAWTKRETNEAQERLREMLPPGSTVHTVLRHVSRSGMSRLIDCYVWSPKGDGGAGEMWWITRLVCAATDTPFDRKREAARVGGCGMDMGFALVYSLSSALYPEGFDCLGEGCPSNHHSNSREPEGHHSSGGYALRHKWI